MVINYNYLFYYLEKEGITIDKTEFLFQIQSHPNYPTLLSITDTLSFFNIDNGALRVEAIDIDLLPNRFIALLDEEETPPQLYFTENKKDKFYCTKDKKAIEEWSEENVKIFANDFNNLYLFASNKVVLALQNF